MKENLKARFSIAAYYKGSLMLNRISLRELDEKFIFTRI